MRKILIFVLALFLLVPMSINATESDETEETIEALSNDVTGTWAAINNGSTNIQVNLLAVDPLTPSIIYAAGEHGVFKSTDGGEHWNASLPNNVLFGLAIAPSSPNIVYAGVINGQGTYRSVDRGENWALVNPGMPGLFNDLVWVIDPKNPNILYVTNDWQGGGVYKSTDGDQSVQATSLQGVYGYAIAIDPINTSTVYVGTDRGYVFMIENGGETWSSISRGLPNAPIHALAVDIVNTSTLYAGTRQGVFKTTMGHDWSVANAGLTDTGITCMAIDPSNTSVIYVGTNSGVFKSTDRGENWSAMNTGLSNTTINALAIDPLNTSTLYAGTDGGGVFKFSSGTEESPSITVSKTGTGTGEVTSTPPGINCGSTCQANFTTGTNVTLTASADSGSTFTGWSGGGCSGTDPCPITLSSNTTITASFALSGSCAYTISPTNKTFKANGGSVSIKASATGPTNCPMPPIGRDAEWISVSGTPTWKANKGTVKIAVQKNPSSQSRTGVVSIGGETLTIGQDGAICQLTALKPSSGKYPTTGSTGSFNVTVSPQDCGWNVATTFDWIHLDTTIGTGNGTAAFHIDANGTGKSRTGKINVSLGQNATKKKTFTLNENK